MLEVLSDINLKIASGEMIALLGPLGVGQNDAPAHSCRTGDRNQRTHPFWKERRHQLTAGERRRGFVFQNYALFRHMTVAENVAFGLTVKPRSERLPKAEIEKRVAELLTMVQLSDKAGHYPAQLSGGQQQRVALCPRCWRWNLRCCSLTSPSAHWMRRCARSSSMDQTSAPRARVYRRICNARSGRTMQVADRVVVMHNGRIEQADKPAEIWEHPKTRFVIEF